MKKTLQLLLVMSLVVASSIGAIAQNTKLYVSDFSIKKGETKTVSIVLENPDYAPSALQFDMYFEGGIVPVERNGRVTLSRQGRVPEDGYSASGSWQENKSYYRYIFYNTYGDKIEGTKGSVFTFKVTTDDTFGTRTAPASITLKNIRLSDIDKTETSYKPSDYKTDVCLSHSFDNLFTADNEGHKCFLDDVITIVSTWKGANGKDYAFATNGMDQWVKIVFPNGNEVMFEGNTYEGGNVGGIISDATLNPTITIENPGEYTLASTTINAGTQVIDLQTASGVELHPNEIINITGFYFINSEGKPCLSAWSGQNGGRGAVVEINTEMCTDVKFIDTQYNFSSALVQRKAAPAAGSPAKVAPLATSPYADFVIYPLATSTDNIITAVDDVKTSSRVTSVRYYNVAGVESSTPFNGINIVVSTHEDGSTTTSKMMK